MQHNSISWVLKSSHVRLKQRNKLLTPTSSHRKRTHCRCRFGNLPTDYRICVHWVASARTAPCSMDNISIPPACISDSYRYTGPESTQPGSDSTCAPYPAFAASLARVSWTFADPGSTCDSPCEPCSGYCSTTTRIAPPFPLDRFCSFPRSPRLLILSASSNVPSLASRACACGIPRTGRGNRCTSRPILPSCRSRSILPRYNNLSSNMRVTLRNIYITQWHIMTCNKKKGRGAQSRANLSRFLK